MSIETVRGRVNVECGLTGRPQPVHIGVAVIEEGNKNYGTVSRNPVKARQYTDYGDVGYRSYCVLDIAQTGFSKRQAH